ncbi:MAG: hypothetical protein MZV65_40585 [Chromatiales bacterium]|nr:hypothetical protein [Chromatiales bacterium]
MSLRRFGFTVDRGSRPRRRLTLVPETGIRLGEPDPTQPTVLTPGVPVTLAIASLGQHYRFSLRLPEPSRLQLAVAEGAPIETHLRLLDLHGALIQERGAHTGQANGFEVALPAGSYQVELMEWGNNNASPDPLTLTASLDTAIDPLEPNDSDEAASVLRPGELAAGRIWPRGDRDVYRIEVERPGFLRVHDQGHPMERHVLIREAEGRLLGEVGAHGDNPLDLTVQVRPGRHYIEVREWGDNNESLTPYRMQADVLPDDGLDDPPQVPGRMNAVRELKLASQTGATLLPVGDQDVYRIAVPGAGRLHVQSHGGMERHMQLLGPNGALLTEHGSHAGNPGKLEWFVEGPGTFFVVLREWGDNAWSHGRPTPCPPGSNRRTCWMPSPATMTWRGPCRWRRAKPSTAAICPWATGTFSPFRSISPAICASTRNPRWRRI